MPVRARRRNETSQKNFAFCFSRAQKKKRRTRRRFSHRRSYLFVEQAEHRHVSTLAAVLEMRCAAATDGGPAGPSAEARWHRDVLLAVDGVADRAADDTGAGLIRPQFLAAFLIVGFELTLWRSGEYQAAAGGQHSAHEGRGRFHGPFLVAAPGIESDQLAMALVPLDAADAPKRLAFDAIALSALDVRAYYPAGNEHHLLGGAVAHRVPPLAAFRGRADVLRLIGVARHFVRIDDGPAFGREPGCPVHLGDFLAVDELAVAAIDAVKEAVAVAVQPDLAPAEIGEDVFVHAVEIPHVEGRVLEVELDRASVRVQCEGGIGVEVVALATDAVPVGIRVAGAPVDGVERRVV